MEVSDIYYEDTTGWDVTPIMNIKSVVRDTFPNSTSPNYTSRDLLDDSRTVSWIYFVSASIVIFLGLIFDILSIAVFLTSRALRSTTTGHYLIALMFADTSFLIGELLRWMTSIIDGERVLGLKFTEHYDAACRSVYFIRYSAKLVSAWLTVTITLERFLTVSMPLKVGQISTTTKAKMVIGGVTVVCMVLSAFPFWTVGVYPWEGINRCQIIDSAQYETWSMLVLRFGSLIVPCIIIFILTILIIVYVQQADKIRHRMSNVAGKSVQKQLTAMLLAVAISFIVLRLPYTICWYLNNYFGQLKLDESRKLEVYKARLITEVIATANYASNFFLFCVCGRAFRKQLFCLRKNIKRPFNLASNTQNSRNPVKRDLIAHNMIKKTHITNFPRNLTRESAGEESLQLEQMRPQPLDIHCTSFDRIHEQTMKISTT